MIAGRVAHALVAGGNFTTLRTAHETIRKAAPHLADEDWGDVLPYILSLAEELRRYPSWAELDEYLARSPKLGLDPSMRSSLVENARKLAQQDHPAAAPEVIPQLVQELVTNAQIQFWSSAMRTARGIVSQGNPVPGAKNASLNPPRAEWVANARRYLADQAKLDFALPPSVPEGGWKENAGLAADALISSLDTPANRCLTGLRHIDDAVAIDRRTDIRCVGILGYTNEGKSGLMRTLAYNMACAGKRVLYIPLEESSEAVWQQFSFLHSYTRPDLDIPPQTTWKSKPHKITAKHRENLRELTTDLQSGTTVKGEIVVVRRTTWAEIEQEVHAGHEGQEWDVVFIDYLAHLQTGDPKNHHDIISNTFDLMQVLAGSYAGGKGVVMITGLQAGKRYADAAAAEEGADWGVYGQGAVDWYTRANHAMDLIISVFHRDPVKKMGLVKLAAYKTRGAAPFPTHFCRIDQRTRRVVDIPGTLVDNHLDLLAKQETERRRAVEAECNNISDMDVEVKLAHITASDGRRPAPTPGPEKFKEMTAEEKAKRTLLERRLTAMGAK